VLSAYRYILLMCTAIINYYQSARRSAGIESVRDSGAISWGCGSYIYVCQMLWCVIVCNGLHSLNKKTVQLQSITKASICSVRIPQNPMCIPMPAQGDDAVRNERRKCHSTNSKLKMTFEIKGDELLPSSTHPLPLLPCSTPLVWR
jgi:hypothetical protein